MYSNVCTLYELIGKCKQKCEVRKNLNEDARPFCIILIYCIVYGNGKRDRFPNKYLISNHWLSDISFCGRHASTFENCLFRYFFPPVHLTEWGASGGLAEWLELETRKKFHEKKKKLDFAICKFRLLPLFLHILCFFAKIFTQNMKVILQKVTLFRMTTFSAPFSIT